MMKTEERPLTRLSPLALAEVSAEVSAEVPEAARRSRAIRAELRHEILWAQSTCLQSATCWLRAREISACSLEIRLLSQELTTKGKETRIALQIVLHRIAQEKHSDNRIVRYSDNSDCVR